MLPNISAEQCGHAISGLLHGNHADNSHLSILYYDGHHVYIPNEAMNERFQPQLEAAYPDDYGYGYANRIEAYAAGSVALDLTAVALFTPDEIMRSICGVARDSADATVQVLAVLEGMRTWETAPYGLALACLWYVEPRSLGKVGLTYENGWRPAFYRTQLDEPFQTRVRYPEGCHGFENQVAAFAAAGEALALDPFPLYALVQVESALKAVLGDRECDIARILSFSQGQCTAVKDQEDGD